MKKIISFILILSLVCSLMGVPVLANEEKTPLDNEGSEPRFLTEQERLEYEQRQEKIDAFKISQQVSTFSMRGDKEVFDGTLEEYDEYIESVKEATPERGGPLFGEVKAETSDEASASTFSTRAASSNSNASYNALVKPAFLNGINHPHLSGRAAEEYISPFDGTLQLNFTDVSLPGRNGLDLNLGRVYKSEQGFVELYSTNNYQYVSPTTYLNQRYALGLGWGLNLPSVEVHKDEEGVIQATYHDGTGAAYRSNYNDEIERDDDGNAMYNGYSIYASNLDNHPNDNVRFKHKDRSYTKNGMRSYFSFTDENNVKQYFTETGELIAIVDSFGNEITFEYQNHNAENLIPFNSYSGNNLGSFSVGSNCSKVSDSYVKFVGSDSSSTGTISSYKVDLDEYCDEYYVSMVYGFPHDELGRYFEGSFDLYCDIYSDGELVAEKLIKTVEPNAFDKVFFIDGGFSLSEVEDEFDLDFSETTLSARLRVSVKGYREIQFDDFRLSPKRPLISKITDTVGRTVEFTYGADLYRRDTDLDYDILVKIYSPTGTLIKEMLYDRNKYTYNSEVNGYDISTDEYYYFWGVDNGEYWSGVDYVTKDGEISNTRWQWTDGYTIEYEGRPFVSAVYNRTSKTYYEYESVNKWIAQSWKQTSFGRYNTGYIQTHRVVKRYDVNNSVDETTNPQINVKEFDYETGFYHDETGYNKKDLRNMSPGYLNPDHGSYIVKVTNPSGSIETYEYTSHTYDEGFRRKWTITLPLLDKHTIKESTSSSADSVVTEYTYGDNYAILSPTEVKVTETVDSDSRTYYTINAYDDDSCLPVMTTLPLTEEEKENVPEYKKVHTEYENISDRYFVPETTKYYQDETGTQLSQSVSYDSMGRPVSQTDEAGNTVYTEYNETNKWLPSRVYYQDPENIGDNERISEVQYLYEDTLLLGPTTTRTKYGDEEYAESHIEYDPKYGGVYKATDEKGNTTIYIYEHAIIGTREENPVISGVSELVPFSF